MGKSNAQKILDLMYDNLFPSEGEQIIYFTVEKAKDKDHDAIYFGYYPYGVIDYDKIKKLNGILPKGFQDKTSFEVPIKDAVLIRSTCKWKDNRSFNVKLLDVLQKAFVKEKEDGK